MPLAPPSPVYGSSVGTMSAAPESDPPGSPSAVASVNPPLALPCRSRFENFSILTGVPDSLPLCGPSPSGASRTLRPFKKYGSTPIRQQDLESTQPAFLISPKTDTPQCHRSLEMWRKAISQDVAVSVERSHVPPDQPNYRPTHPAARFSGRDVTNYANHFGRIDSNVSGDDLRCVLLLSTKLAGGLGAKRWDLLAEVEASVSELKLHTLWWEAGELAVLNAGVTNPEGQRVCLYTDSRFTAMANADFTVKCLGNLGKDLDPIPAEDVARMGRINPMYDGWFAGARSFSIWFMIGMYRNWITATDFTSLFENWSISSDFVEDKNHWDWLSSDIIKGREEEIHWKGSGLREDTHYPLTNTAHERIMRILNQPLENSNSDVEGDEEHAEPM